MIPALIVRDLIVSLQGRSMVDGASFTIGAGERVALLGASGSGKSLTAAALLGQLPASMDVSGELEICGDEVHLSSRRRRGSRVTAVHQDPMSALNPLVRLGKQLEMPLRRTRIPAAFPRCKPAS